MLSEGHIGFSVRYHSCGVQVGEQLETCVSGGEGAGQGGGGGGGSQDSVFCNPTSPPPAANVVCLTWDRPESL